MGASPLSLQKMENLFHCCLYNLLVDSLTSSSRTSLESADQEREEDKLEEETEAARERGETVAEEEKEEEGPTIGAKGGTVEGEEGTSSMEIPLTLLRGVGNPKQGEIGSPSTSTTGLF